jgi:hypothetical protein
MARQPATAAAKPRRKPVFVTGNEVVMENPYLGEGQFGGGTLAQSWDLGNAKSLSKS